MVWTKRTKRTLHPPFFQVKKTLSLAEIQEQEQKEQEEFQRQWAERQQVLQQRLRMQQEAAAAAASSSAWGARVAKPVAKKSLAQIQAEEQTLLEKQRKQHSIRFLSPIFS